MIQCRTLDEMTPKFVRRRLKVSSNCSIVTSTDFCWEREEEGVFSGPVSDPDGKSDPLSCSPTMQFKTTDRLSNRTEGVRIKGQVCLRTLSFTEHPTRPSIVLSCHNSLPSPSTNTYPNIQQTCASSLLAVTAGQGNLWSMKLYGEVGFK